MFTGIVEGTGEVTSVETTADGRRLEITSQFLDDLTRGASVSIDGACLTIESINGRSLEVFLASETIDRTTLGARNEGDFVNVERAMPASGRFDGHLVQGHVDTTSRITDIQPIGEDWLYVFELPDGYKQYVVEKGSITIDGISLTVTDLSDTAGTFTVAIIPETYRQTTLSEKKAGTEVNIEVDIVAKYIERILSEHRQ